MKDNPSGDATQVWMTHNIIVDHDADDYYEIYVYADTNPSTPVAYSLGGGVNFGAFRLIT